MWAYRFILIVLFAVLIPVNSFAYNGMVHSASEGLTGTVGDELDVISVTDSDGYGHTLTTGDVAIVSDPVNSLAYIYTYDSTSTASENSPLVILPNDQAAGTGAWLLAEKVRLDRSCFTIETPTDTDDNVPVMSPILPITVTNIYCRVEGGTSIAITLSDGTNDLDAVTCTTTGAADDGAIANNTFVADERVEFDSAAPTGSVTWLNYCFWYVETP